MVVVAPAATDENVVAKVGAKLVASAQFTLTVSVALGVAFDPECGVMTDEPDGVPQVRGIESTGFVPSPAGLPNERERTATRG